MQMREQNQIEMIERDADFTQPGERAGTRVDENSRRESWFGVLCSHFSPPAALRELHPGGNR